MFDKRFFLFGGGGGSTFYLFERYPWELVFRKAGFFLGGGGVLHSMCLIDTLFYGKTHFTIGLFTASACNEPHTIGSCFCFL